MPYGRYRRSKSSRFGRSFRRRRYGFKKRGPRYGKRMVQTNSLSSWYKNKRGPRRTTLTLSTIIQRRDITIPANTNGDGISTHVPIRWGDLHKRAGITSGTTGPDGITGVYQRLKLRKATLFIVVDASTFVRSATDSNPLSDKISTLQLALNKTKDGTIFNAFTSRGAHVKAFSGDATAANSLKVGMFGPTIDQFAVAGASMATTTRDEAGMGASSGWIPGNPGDATQWNGFIVTAAVPDNTSAKTVSLDYWWQLHFTAENLNYK